MNATYYPYTDIRGSSPIVNDYLSGKLDAFVQYQPTLAGLSSATSQRSFPIERRKILVDVLKQQYEKITHSDAVANNIEKLLQVNAFTVCTGHQLGIFTGPLFTIYKVLHTLALAQKLQSESDTHHFIPIFWLASEDHDLAEINHLHLFGKKYSWETNQAGAVGRMSCEGLAALASEIRQLFTNDQHANQLLSIIENAYHQADDLAHATQMIFNQIAGEYGLLILNPDDKDLKSSFATYMVEDIIHEANHEALMTQTASLGKLYKTQVFPRHVNYFHLQNQSRIRIPSKEEGGNEFTAEYILQHADEFSPNVCMRPLYQETVLPNIAYIGGPGEISYWLQFKTMFERNRIPFPVLIPRHSIFLQSSSFQKRFGALGFKSGDIFRTLETLKDDYLMRNAELEELNDIKQTIETLRVPLRLRVKHIDATLEATADQIISKALEQLQTLVGRLNKSQKQKYDVDLRKIEKLYTEQYPDNSPQDRFFNWLQYAGLVNIPFLTELMQREISGCFVIEE